MANLRRLNAFRKQYRSHRPRMRWQFIAFGHNEHEIPAARRLAKELGMSFHVKLAWDDFSPLSDGELVRREAGAATREEFRRTQGAGYVDSICSHLWDQPQINWDGRVLGCSRNFWGEFGGNAFRDGLTASVNSERIQYARGMLTGLLPAREDVPCATCDIYLDRKASGRWVERRTPSLPVRATRALLRGGAFFRSFLR